MSLLQRGDLSFTIESRILQELGERLVKQPEVALLELVKNAYDADATYCMVDLTDRQAVVVKDDGLGMTLKQFEQGWMRIGTSAKGAQAQSPKFNRAVTGEKGIGRFAVRFLGQELRLESIAYDKSLRKRTKLTARFDWPDFDKKADLGKITVPFRLDDAPGDQATGTTLTISKLRADHAASDLRQLRTGAMTVLSPLRSLFLEAASDEEADELADDQQDPGFVLRVVDGTDSQTEEDVAQAVLQSFVLRSKLVLKDGKLSIRVFRRGERKAHIKIVDRFPGNLGTVYADLRFFPRRKGTFTGLSVNGKAAQAWIKDNAGVAVFDRRFRVLPYGLPSDDWLHLGADANRNLRDPRSTISQKHFPMDAATRAAPSENWMIRLPEPGQLVGIVRVAGQRSSASADGLVASADREGFVENEAFLRLVDLVRGAAEAIAVADRELANEEAEEKERSLLRTLRADARSAIEEVENNPRIGAGDKRKIIASIANTLKLSEQQAESAAERGQQLEVMSLLGVVAGFMTHEFGVAMQAIEEARAAMLKLAKTQPSLKATAAEFEKHVQTLETFVEYSQAYIRGTRVRPAEPYPARPRLAQVKKVFGKYAEDRGISVEINADPDVKVPPVPAALYNGIALNLYTNALKAVAASKDGNPGVIAFSAWNDDRWHYLEVADTGIGIPTALSERVFEPLFTTTDSNNDPLGSGMGLGLALVRRSAQAFGGKVELVSAPAGFTTSVQVRLPLGDE